MKKIIILLLVLLMSACSAVKPAETLSSMQTEPTAETTVAETTAPEETTESTPKETETAIKVPKEETTAPLIIEQPEQKATLEITTETITETPVESATMETTAEPPKAEFDVNYWISFARSYALQIGLEIDPTAVDCWDNPTTANADCIYLERDLTHRLDRYNRDDNITAVNIWAESLGNGNYLIYIAYA